MAIRRSSPGWNKQKSASDWMRSLVFPALSVPPSTTSKRSSRKPAIRLMSGMLTMRRHEKDFMLRRDPKYVDELNKSATEFSKAVAASELAPAMKADIEQKLQKYRADFGSWAKGAQEA